LFAFWFPHDIYILPYLTKTTTSTPKTQHDGRFYELHIRCPEKYPAVPPEVRFVSKINMTCVDPKTGMIIANKVPAMRNWNRNMGIEQVLVSLRMEMLSDQNRRLRQPAEGSRF
jgi:ubiquitin-conjugating enzyme E2 variant